MGPIRRQLFRVAAAALLVAALLPFGTALGAGAPMTLTFSPVAPSFTIGLPLNGTVNAVVDWGDGSSDPYVTGGVKTHSYANAGPWTVSVTGAVTHFGTASANPNAAALTAVTAWGDVGITDLSYAFLGATALTSVPATLPAGVTSLASTFKGATSFNGAIDGWDTSHVTSMASAFETASAFNQPIGSWNTASVTSMLGTFSNATAFNQDIGTWDTSRVTDLMAMFAAAAAFNQPIGGWDTSKVTRMGSLFANAATFNQDISGWVTSGVTGMASMFMGAAAFNQPIGAWDTSKVTDMNNMFANAQAFNGSIGGWDTSKVTNMSQLFLSAGAFNQPIGSWNTGSATDMSAMFWAAHSFDQDISTWDTSKVTTMFGMFTHCTAFNHSVGAWDTSRVTSMKNMFYSTSLTTATYSAILNAWAAKPQLSGVPFSAGSTTYSASAVDARDTLTSTYGWVITDGGLAPVATPLYVVPSGVSVAYGTDPATVVYSATYYTDADHATEITPTITGSAPVCTAAAYTASVAVGEYAGAITCTGGSDDAYTFDTSAAAALTVTEVVSPPLPDTSTQG